jgi:hypothetical protein
MPPNTAANSLNYRKCTADELRHFIKARSVLTARQSTALKRTRKHMLVSRLQDMDELLVSLWKSSLHHQAVVLYVLETLSEEVFNREDPTAGLRGSDLGRACVEIFTPLAVIQDQLPTREKSLDVRCGDEGWLKRLCDNLGWCLGQDYQNQEAVKTSAIKSMQALKAAMPWIMPKAIAATQVIEAVCKALATPAVEMQIVCRLFTSTHMDSC